MARLMERVTPHVDFEDVDAVDQIALELRRIAPICRWTDGVWEELSLPWNEVQNTPRHISALSNLLARKYLDARANR